MKPTAAIALLAMNCSNHQLLSSRGSPMSAIVAIPKITNRSNMRLVLVAACFLLASIGSSSVGVSDSVALEDFLYALRGESGLCGYLHGTLVP